MSGISTLPSIKEYISVIDALVFQYGIEYDYFAWEKIKECLKDYIREPKNYYDGNAKSNWFVKEK